PSTSPDAFDSLPLSPVWAWPQGPRLLQQLWAASARRSTATPAATADRTAAAPTVYAGQEQGLAVLCSDSPNPRSLSAYAADARLAYARSGAIGPAWVCPPPPCPPRAGPGGRAPAPPTGPPARGTGRPPPPFCCSGTPAMPSCPPGTPWRWSTTWPAPACSPLPDTATPGCTTRAPAPSAMSSATCRPV